MTLPLLSKVYVQLPDIFKQEILKGEQPLPLKETSHLKLILDLLNPKQFLKVT